MPDLIDRIYLPIISALSTGQVYDNFIQKLTQHDYCLPPIPLEALGPHQKVLESFKMDVWQAFPKAEPEFLNSQPTNIPKGKVIISYIDIVEEHGPHMPLCQDPLISMFLCKELTDRLKDKVVYVPGIAYGITLPPYASKPGSISLENNTLTDLVINYTRWLGETFNPTKIVYFTSHGPIIHRSLVAEALGRVHNRFSDIELDIRFGFDLVAMEYGNKFEIRGHSGRNEAILQALFDSLNGTKFFDKERAEPGERPRINYIAGVEAWKTIGKDWNGVTGFDTPGGSKNSPVYGDCEVSEDGFNWHAKDWLEAMVKQATILIRERRTS